MKSQSNLVFYLYINCHSTEGQLGSIYLHFHFEGYENERSVSFAFLGLFRIDRGLLQITQCHSCFHSHKHALSHHYNSISITVCYKFEFFLPFKYLNTFCCLAAVQCYSFGPDKYWNNKTFPCNLFLPLGCKSLQQIWPFNLIRITFHCIDPPAPTASLPLVVWLMHCLPREHLFLYSTNLNLGFWWAHSRCGFGYGEFKSLLMKVITHFQICLSLTSVYNLTSLCFCFLVIDSVWGAVSVMTKDSLFVCIPAWVKQPHLWKIGRLPC